MAGRRFWYVGDFKLRQANGVCRLWVWLFVSSWLSLALNACVSCGVWECSAPENSLSVTASAEFEEVVLFMKVQNV